MLNLLFAISLLMLNFSAYAEIKNFENTDVEVSANTQQSHAQLKKADAEKWLADFSAAREKTGDPLFLKNFEKRQSHTRILMGLRDQADKLFGSVVSQLGACTKAVESVNEYWKTEVSLITDPANNQTIKVGSVVTFAWDGGASFVSCSSLIQQLK